MTEPKQQTRVPYNIFDVGDVVDDKLIIPSRDCVDCEPVFDGMSLGHEQDPDTVPPVEYGGEPTILIPTVGDFGKEEEVRVCVEHAALRASDEKRWALRLLDEVVDEGMDPYEAQELREDALMRAEEIWDLIDRSESENQKHK